VAESRPRQPAEVAITDHASPRSRSLLSMGEYLDGFVELLDGHSAFAPHLAEYFLFYLRDRNIPNSTITNGELRLGQDRRDYQFIDHKTGAYLNIRIAAYGTDLLIKWDAWWKPKLRWLVILILLGLSLLVGLMSGNTPYGFYFTIVFGVFFSTLIGLTIAVMIAGVLLRGSPTAFFFNQFDYFTKEDVAALTFAVDHSLRIAADQVGIKVKLRDRTEFYSGAVKKVPIRLM
jgi:hypothetical protein